MTDGCWRLKRWRRRSCQELSAVKAVGNLGTDLPVRRSATIIVGVLLACVVAAALLAPYVYSELEVWTQPHAIVDSAPAHLSRGRMVDDYFAIEDLGDGTFAIGEPRY